MVSAFGRVRLMWLHWYCGVSIVEKLPDSEWRIVVLLIVVFIIVSVLVVSLSCTSCLVVRCWLCWLCCRSRGDRRRVSRWLFESGAYAVTFHSIPFQAVFRRSGPSHVAREIVVVSVGPFRLKVGRGRLTSSWPVSLGSGTLVLG